MLALSAIIAGSVMTGYSAYRIHAARRGKGRKLRDMEVLRRLNIPPKKQARVWSVLMVLGLVLLTPGVGLLLKSDRTSGDGGELSPSSFRPAPSGSPILAPPSEKMDKTPRDVDEGVSSSLVSGVAFASSGGGGKSSSSGGGGGRSSTASAKDDAAEADEAAEVVYDEAERSPKGNDSTYRPSRANETPEIYKADSASDLPRIGEDGGTKTRSIKPEVSETRRGSENLSSSSSELAEGPAAAGASDSSDVEEALTEPSSPVDESVVEGGGDEVAVPDLSRPTTAKSVPSPSAGETRTEAEVADVAREKSTVSDDPGRLASGAATIPTSAEAKTESAAIDVAREKRTDPNGSRRSAAVGAGDAIEMGAGVERTAPPNLSGSSVAKEEFDRSTTSSPEADEGRSQEETPLGPEDLDPAAETHDSIKIEDPSAMTTVLALDPGPKVEDVKRLQFREENRSETLAMGNLSGDEPSLSESWGLNGSTGTEAGLAHSIRGFDFGAEFDNFASTTLPGIGTQKNWTANPVMMMEFEKIDIESSFRRDLSFTPTSPLR